MTPAHSQSEFFAALVSANWDYRQKLEASAPFKAYVTSLDATLNVLKTVGSSGDVDKILGTESSLVKLEHKLHQGNDPSVMPSLNAAVVDFSVIQTLLKLVRDTEGYRMAAASHHSKHKTKGVVIDGCHEAINAHVTRLGNRMQAVGISVPEKNILRQRQTNLRTAKALYIELQCAVLGVEPPKRSKGLAR